MGAVMLNRRNLLRVGGSAALAAVASGEGLLSPAFGADTDWTRLAGRLQGDLVLPGDANYPYAKQLQFATFDWVNPQAIAYCETIADVQACVRVARRNGVDVRVRSGGHNFEGWSTGPGLVIDVSRLNHVSVGASTVHMGPGAASIDALAALAPYNKQIIAGTCPTVCPGGFLSGGGIGNQTRRFGLGADRLVSAKVVLADGSVVHCSPTRDSSLFWALRGSGGGSFGIVVDFAPPCSTRLRAVPTSTSPASSGGLGMMVPSMKGRYRTEIPRSSSFPWMYRNPTFGSRVSSSGDFASGPAAARNSSVKRTAASSDMGTSAFPL